MVLSYVTLEVVGELAGVIDLTIPLALADGAIPEAAYLTRTQVFGSR